MTALLERTKACSTCHAVKPFTAYYRAASTRDGREARCIVCQKARGAKYTSRFGPRTQCVHCGGAMTTVRMRGGHRTCSRTCLLANIGLPSDFVGRGGTYGDAEVAARLLMARAFGQSRRAVPDRIEREIRATWEAVRRGQW